MSADELARAREITAAVRGVSGSDLERDNIQSRRGGWWGLVVIFALIGGLGAVGWWWPAAAVDAPVVELPTREERMQALAAERSRMAPASVAPQRPPVASPAAPRPVAKPVPSAPVSRGSSAPSALPGQRDASAIHQEYAVRIAQDHFENDYVIGSANYKIIEVVCHPNRTVSVAGWRGRYRTTGTVEIVYLDLNGTGMVTTRREFEIETTSHGGEIELMDLTVK